MNQRPTAEAACGDEEKYRLARDIFHHQGSSGSFCSILLSPGKGSCIIGEGE